MDKRDVIEAIGRQKAKYCRFVDTKQWDAFERLFDKTPQMTFFDADGAEMARFESLSEFLATTRSFLADARSHHQVHSPEITVLSETEASAVWSMEDFILFPRGDESRPQSLHGFDHYHEIWRLRGDEWVLVRMELRRTILETKPQEQLS